MAGALADIDRDTQITILLELHGFHITRTRDHGQRGAVRKMQLGRSGTGGLGLLEDLLVIGKCVASLFHEFGKSG